MIEMLKSIPLNVGF